jgi:hypothetical protein
MDGWSTICASACIGTCGIDSLVVKVMLFKIDRVFWFTNIACSYTLGVTKSPILLARPNSDRFDRHQGFGFMCRCHLVQLAPSSRTPSPTLDTPPAYTSMAKPLFFGASTSAAMTHSRASAKGFIFDDLIPPALSRTYIRTYNMQSIYTLVWDRAAWDSSQ